LPLATQVIIEHTHIHNNRKQPDPGPISKQSNILYIIASQQIDHPTHGHAVIRFNNKLPKTGKSYNKTPLEVRPSPTDSASEFNRLSSILRDTASRLYPPTRMSKPLNLSTNDTRGGSRRTHADDKPPRIMARAKRCNGSQEVHDPSGASSTSRSPERLPSVDIVSLKKDPETMTI
jgi:hypothetical protein